MRSNIQPVGEGALPQEGGRDGGVKKAAAAGPAPEQEFQLGRREELCLSPTIAPCRQCIAVAVFHVLEKI